MFLIRTRGEIDYYEQLLEIPNERVEARRGQEVVSDDAWVWDRAHFVAEFRYILKRGTYWKTYVKNTRSLRAWK